MVRAILITSFGARRFTAKFEDFNKQGALQMQPAETYHDKGYYISDPLFSASELAEVSSLLDHLVARAADCEEMAKDCVFERDQPASKRGGVAIEPDSKAVFIVGDVPRFCPQLIPFLTDLKLVDLVASFLGTSDIVMHFANLTMKSAKIGSGINWHRDFLNKFICPVAPSMVRTMICVDGMSPDTGATRFLSGSHNEPGQAASDVEPMDDRIEVAACSAGAVAAIHPLVLHCGPPNFSPLPRRNIVIQWGRTDVPLATDFKESVTGKTIECLRAEVNRINY